MLANESKGLPSSSYEFVPILFPLDKVYRYNDITDINIFKYGEIINHNKVDYLLTNLRALLNDISIYSEMEHLRNFYNSESHCEIIKKHFKVYKVKTDISTSKQYIRSRVNLQELSRRYVSGKKVPFDFYISKNMKGIVSKLDDEDLSTDDIVSLCLNHYMKALSDGVKPQEARRIIPQCAYTEIWSAWQPKQLDNFLKLRTKNDSQWEIRQLALQKQQWLNEEKGN